MQERRLPAQPGLGQLTRLTAGLALTLLLPIAAPAAPVPPASTGGGFPLIEPYWEGLPKEDLPGIQRAWRSALEGVAADLADEGRPAIQAPGLDQELWPERLIRATISGDKTAYYANFQLLDKEGEGVAARLVRFSEPGPGLPLELARAIESLLVPRDGQPQSRPPRLVDAFSPADLVGVDIPAPGPAYLYPYGLAARKDGSLVAALMSTVLEFGPAWEVRGQIGKALADEGTMSYAFGLSMSPSGTLILRNADGTGTWSFPEGSKAYRRLRLEAPPGSTFGVLDDGSPFVMAYSPHIARVYGNEGVRDIPLAKDDYILAASAGPDNTLWLYDVQTASVRVLDAQAFFLRDLIFPDLAQGASIMKLKVLPDSSFLAITNTDIRRFDPRGRLLWSWDGRAEGLAPSFSTLTDIAQTGPGIYCLNDLSAKRILRIAEDGAALSPLLARIGRSYLASTRTGAGQAQALLDLASAYEEAGGLEAARASLARYLELKPTDQAVAERAAGLEAGLVSARAAAGEAEVLSLLSRFGPERARAAYMGTMKTLEGLRALAPDEPEVTRRIGILKKAFKDAEDGTAIPPPQPRIAKVELGPLFPALLQVYRTRSPGRLRLRNTLASPLSELRAEVFIPKYMDYPSEGPGLASLAPGQEAELELLVLLNQRVLEVEEDLPLQALVTLRYKEGGAERRLETTTAFTLHRRSALTWDDTGHLASFITPNDESLASAAFSMLKAAPEAALPTTALARAAALCDSLGALPLAYVPDPQSPFARALGDARVVDTVRFPRTTLAFQGGDCDDTTALLCSLLEAAGLPTAILTSPGHVFLAFDSGEAGDSAWLLAAPGYEGIAAGGRLWIPLESTELSQGFAGAWKAASGLVARYRGTKDLAILPLAGLRESYLALPLPPSALPLPRPDGESLALLAGQSLARLSRELYTPVLAGLEAARLAGKNWEKDSNRLARAQAWYGRVDAATATLAALVERSPAYLPAYLNLAALASRAGRPKDAAAWLARAEGAAPGSAAPAEYATRLGIGKPGAVDGAGGPQGSPAQGGVEGRAGIETGPAWAD